MEAKELELRLSHEVIDVTLPAKKMKLGHRHPNTIALEEVERIFIGMGYEVVEGPEVELDYYNFEALNIPDNHPAKDEQDTFYINDKILLRTQTSPVQVREMEKGALLPAFKPLRRIKKIYGFITFLIFFSISRCNFIMILSSLNLKGFFIGFKTREFIRFLIIGQNVTANQVIICCFTTF